jgi:3-hydroxyisobutyrate dehydrogenase-like beta-hydroxyacid dehydrogenase
MTTIGFVGLGAMGGALAGRLLQGNQVYGTNRTRARASARIELGSSITHVGGNGQGLLLKLAVNISLAAQMLAFSEGLLLAERGGIDPGLAARAMSESAIGSPMLRARTPLVLDLPGQAWSDAQLMHKDIRLALEAAREAKVPLPAASVAGSVLSRAEDLGYGHRDIASMFQVLARMAPDPAAAAGPGTPAINAADAGPEAA